MAGEEHDMTGGVSFTHITRTAEKGSRLSVAVMAAVTIVAGADARAQPPPSPPASTRQAIECGAGEGKRRVCAADTSAGVVLTSQAGAASCVLGTTWGFDASGVWVAEGCHGTFAFTDDRPTATCAAAAGAREICAANTADGVTLVRASPVCVLGRTWGYDEDGIWVSDGCQASFVLTTRAALMCDSDGERQDCAADTSAGVVLARSTATAACVLGQTWGYDADGVWVDKGCHAEFVLGAVDPGGEEDTDLDKYFGLFNPYGRFLGHLAFFNDEIEVQDNLSWIGLDFSTRGPVKLFAATEWGVNLMRGGLQFNPSANTDSGFPEVIDTQAEQVFYNRFGYVGADFGPFGRIAVGKQWAVYTDVTLYTTDQFNVFGSEASATYTAGTDGGPLGTGRADQALTYRADVFRILRLGGQLQFRTADNGEVIDGYGRLVWCFRGSATAIWHGSSCRMTGPRQSGSMPTGWKRSCASTSQASRPTEGSSTTVRTTPSWWRTTSGLATRSPAPKSESRDRLSRTSRRGSSTTASGHRARRPASTS
jgi:hypothetical protein